MRHHQASDKKSDDGDQAGFLKIGHTKYGMALGASAGISGAESDQKPTNDNEQNAINTSQ
jgi:PIN domain nuclease of toxin-antitoxin system